MDKTNGLIIKQSDYGDGNRMLTVFTEDFGIIKAAVYGVKRAKSRQSAASQFLTWAEFMLFFGRGDVATINSVASTENFFPIQEDLEKLALCTYLADITYYAQTPNTPNLFLLKLLLNTFYALSYRNLAVRKAKVVYELRLTADMGYAPTLNRCVICGEENEPQFFSCGRDGVVCKGCHSSLFDDIPMTLSAYHAICYILYAEEKKVFSFEVSREVLREISNISERYVLYRLEKDFSSLNYLKNILTD